MTTVQHGFRAVTAAALLVFAHQVSAVPGNVPGSQKPAKAGGSPRYNLCVNGAGVDQCALFGINVNYVGRNLCSLTGAKWTAQFAWFTNVAGGTPEYPLSYPPSYQTAFPDDPMADYLSKLVSLRIVVDGGTPSETVYTFAASSIAHTTTYGTIGGYTADQDVSANWPGVVLVPVLSPLIEGLHGARVYVTLSARHCDGIGGCLPAGETLVRGGDAGPPQGFPFTVDPKCGP